MRRPGGIFAVFVLVSCLVAGGTSSFAQTTFTFNGKGGTDVRHWFGANQTTHDGYQAVENYGYTMKLNVEKAFEFTHGTESGYMYSLARICTQVGTDRCTGLVPSVTRQRFESDGSLDVFTFSRLELTVNSIWRPYAFVGYNYSPNKTRSPSETLSMANDPARDLRTSYGAGDFWESKIGSIVRLGDSLKLDLYWKRNYGTAYNAYTFQRDMRTDEGSDSYGASIKYSTKKVLSEIKYERTNFGLRSSDRFDAIANPVFPYYFEMWRPGDFHIVSTKFELNITDEIYWFNSANYSWQERDQRGYTNNNTGVFAAPPALFLEGINMHAPRWGIVSGIGYEKGPWNFEWQGSYSEQKPNGYPRTDPNGNGDSDLFIPRRIQFGAEILAAYKASKNVTFETRLAYLHIPGYNGTPSGPGAACLNQCTYDADIFTAYFTGRVRW